MAHVQIRGGVADWYWTADPNGKWIELDYEAAEA
jgi:hypothetical protein